MKSIDADLKSLLTELAEAIEQDLDGEIEHRISFIQSPHLALELIDIIAKLPEEVENAEETLTYSACIFALDICVMQLKTAVDLNQKLANKALNDLMKYIAVMINKHNYPLVFWLPIMNAFYDAQVELGSELKDAYVGLAYIQEDDIEEYDAEDHLAAIRAVITDLADLSVFDLAENFFAQSYAMPPDFFSDLIIDFFSITEAQDVALLILLHPNAAVREVALHTFLHLIDSVVLSGISLTRLQVIQQWYRKTDYTIFTKLLKTQRKKGVIFEKVLPLAIVAIHATEIDGGGAQGLFIHVKNGRNNRVCGLLLKQEIGIKEAWVTPSMTGVMVQKYYKEAFDSSITLRKVDSTYLKLLVDHFLAITLERGNCPNLHLLEIQEVTGIAFIPQKIDIDDCINQMSIQISPFTDELVQDSLKRSKSWVNNKSFTESWFIESVNVDKLVNQCSRFIEGAKVCDFEMASQAVFTEELEVHRDKWLFHFLWTSLWSASIAKKAEKLWLDSFIIAYLIHTNAALDTIPIMQEICRQSIFNSVETMEERRTYLN